MSEHDRCTLARAYRRCISLDERRALAAEAGLTLAELRRLCAAYGCA